MQSFLHWCPLELGVLLKQLVIHQGGCRLQQLVLVFVSGANRDSTRIYSAYVPKGIY